MLKVQRSNFEGWAFFNEIIWLKDPDKKDLHDLVCTQGE